MQQDLTIRLNPEMQRAIGDLARKRDVSVGQVVREALVRELRRAANAKPPVRADEQLLAPLRARLAGDLAQATGWSDLEARLKEKGYVLRVAGGGLALHRWPADRRVCKASELGFSYSKLMRRFRTPFPSHPHLWLAERMLNDTPPPEEDDALFEPFD